MICNIFDTSVLFGTFPSAQQATHILVALRYYRHPNLLN